MGDRRERLVYLDGTSLRSPTRAHSRALCIILLCPACSSTLQGIAQGVQIGESREKRNVGASRTTVPLLG